MSLKSILENLQRELRERERVKEEVQQIMRKATQLSKRAIIFIHQKKMDEAKNLLEDAKKLFRRLREVCSGYPDMFYSGIVNAAFQEYAEANIFVELTERGGFLSPSEIDVPVVNYILGLADVIGELRRQALDSLRRGNLNYAEKCLETMETIYLELMAMDEGFILVPGLRRKCDVARRIIETTRGELTVESRRNRLEEAIRRLEEKLEEETES